MPRRKAFILVRIARGVWRFFGTCLYYVRNIWREMVEDDILFLASAVAFNGILTIIPLMLFSASAVGILLQSSDRGISQLTDILNAVFPPQPFAASIRVLLLGVITDIIEYRRSLGTVGFLVLIWTATFLFDALRNALHRIYHIKRTRGLLASFLRDVGFVFLAFILFIASNLSIWIYTFLKNTVAGTPALRQLRIQTIEEAAPTVIVIVLTAFMFYVIYGHMTDSKPPRAAAAISTFSATFLWVISAKLFAVYLSDYSVIGSIYGPYAFLVVFLLWVYYSSILFVLGGIIGQVHWERLKSAEEHAVD